MDLKKPTRAIRGILTGLLLLTVTMGTAQECPDLISPQDGAVDVPVDATISWDPVPGIPGYRIDLGTTPGGNQILSRSLGSATSFTPLLGLPENTLIYVTITLDFLFEGGEDIVCPSQSFRTLDVTTAPGCTALNVPGNGATGVSIFSNLSWPYAPTATGYRVSIGSSPGATDVFDQDVGNILTFNPPGDFDPLTDYFVRITPYNENGSAASCSETQFTTGDVATLPGCTSLITPANGDINVPLTPFLEWTAVPNAEGYRVTIGSTPFNADILDDVAFFSSSTFVINFLPNQTFFIRIIPFNAAGLALGCEQESFSTQLGCGPYLDPNTGDLIQLNPEIDFPELFSFCENESPLVVESDDDADGFRWYAIDRFGNEAVISDSNEVVLATPGMYRYEAYNIVNQNGLELECPTSQLFEVVSSEIATVESVDIIDNGEFLQFTVNVTGIGRYSYALNSPEGPFQDSPVFNSVLPGSYTVFVKDENGCGITSFKIEQDLSIEGFPKFFTPNGDGINDYWQYIPPRSNPEVDIAEIHVFDRYGNFLVQVDPLALGWDGTLNGRPLPSSVYWFKVRDGKNNVLHGFFALKR